MATSTTNCDGGTPITSAIDGEERRLQQIVEQMVAVVGPERHLPLAVMHRMQFPPEPDAMFPAVVPVAGEIQHQQIHHERDEGCVVTPGHRLSNSMFEMSCRRSHACTLSNSGCSAKKKNRLRMPSFAIHV